jgi:hypothetical protein
MELSGAKTFITDHIHFFLCVLRKLKKASLDFLREPPKVEDWLSILRMNGRQRYARRCQSDLADRDAIFRFYDGPSKLFDNLSLWTVPYRLGMEMTDRQQILNFPPGRPPLAGSFAHIFPSIASLPDLIEQFFHMAIVTPPEEGVRTIYSLIFEMLQSVPVMKDGVELTLPEKSLVILALESRYVHPFVFYQLLIHFFNSFTSGRLFSMDQSEIELYADGQREVHKTGAVTLEQFPHDISPDAEIGRLHHFAFTAFRVKQILSIIFHLVVGDQVIATSISTERLSIGCFALISLLYPVQWSIPFIPVLPEELRDHLGSPFPFLIGVPFRWIEDNVTEGMDPCLVVNLDIGAVIAPEPEPVYGARYNILAQKMSARLAGELAIYTSSGVFPAYRIRIVLWQFIAGIMAITAGMAVPGKLNVMDVCRGILELRETTKGDIPRNSYQRLVLESTLIVHFAEQVTSGVEQLKVGDKFANVFDGMQDVLAAISKGKK